MPLLNRLIDTNDLMPKEKTIDQFIRVAATSTAEQILRTIGEKFDAQILRIDLTKPETQRNKLDFDVYIYFRREHNHVNADRAQVPVGFFTHCRVALASLRLPSALLTVENCVMKIVNGAFYSEETGHAVICQAMLNDDDKSTLLERYNEVGLEALLTNHVASISPGFFGAVEKVSFVQDKTSSQGIIVIDPVDELSTSYDDQQKQILNLNFVNLHPRKRPFVAVYTMNENFRQITSGDLSYEINKDIDEPVAKFMINASPYQKHVGDEPTGGAYEILERKASENDYLSTVPDLPREKYMILLSRKTYGLSPTLTHAIRTNIKEAIQNPMMAANDEFNRQLGRPDGTYQKLVTSLKDNMIQVILFFFLGLFLLQTFSGVATTAINTFFGALWSFVSGNARQSSRKLKQLPLKQLTNERTPSRMNKTNTRTPPRRKKNTRTPLRRKKNKKL